jgi:choline kinase
MLAGIDAAGIEEVIVVAGHQGRRLEEHLASSDRELAQKAQVVHNDRYAEWGNFYSLLVAQDQLWDDDFIKLDGDVLFDDELLPILLAADGHAVLCLDRKVELGSEEMKARLDENLVVELNKRIDPAAAAGESIGIERINSALVPTLFAELRSMIDDGETGEYYERAYERLMEQGIDFGYADISQCVWYEIDDAEDLERANQLFAGE